MRYRERHIWAPAPADADSAAACCRRRAEASPAPVAAAPKLTPPLIDDRRRAPVASARPPAPLPADSSSASTDPALPRPSTAAAVASAPPPALLPTKGFNMVELTQSYHELEKCTKDILSVIKPTEDDRNKRMHAVQEIVNSIYLVSGLGDAAVKPFGSFLSNLYAKSGDLDVSVELPNVFGFLTSKEQKQDVLRELMIALQIKGVARDVNFIPAARVPVLQYVSNKFGISCDISINNYPGRIKSKVLYWISTIDERFGDMVLLVKEWAKAQNINDPKDGTLNSYSLCLLVLFHFQTCKPAI
uniref:Uncharacterized protein n=1 Tax=Avena sativa TaxID=4498 RepID=A0ACD5VV36_AVESA